jgi:alkylated DNA repair dioxygenase AlkB
MASIATALDFPVACGSDDSYLLQGLLADNHKSIFQSVRTTTPWLEISHRGNLLPRLVCTQAIATDYHKIPIYRHPIDKEAATLPFTQTTMRIRNAIEELVPSPPLNHALIQLYRNGHDFIGQHSDKTLDIHPGSSIMVYSIGAERTMRLTHKTQQGRIQLIPLPHDSVFIMGLKTNREWYHEIRPDKRRKEEKSLQELAYGEERISLTFRSIATYKDEMTGQLSGQGAQRLYVDPETEKQNILKAFSEENRDPDFDWRRHYGNGCNLTCLP